MRAAVCMTIIITAASSATAWGQSLKAQVVCAAQAERAYQAYKNAAFVPGFKFGSGAAGIHTVPSTATPSAQKWNDIGADVVLAKNFKRLVCGGTPW